jgi:CDP-diacylglycerol--glycerol-3-phosphate 3-phosphatidyltransferase|tara:strand:- start:194 stop:736 length:543 start_codon:yes stop_codon:yes gene_type:complete
VKQYIPDLLAIFRIISAPVILYLILLDGSNEGLMLIPAIIAFIAAWTDFFDGRLARKWNVTSKTGAFLDTIADKIFITFIFIGFTYIDRVSIWITTLLIVREFIITGLRGLAGNEGIMIPPSKFGKAKASFQFWAVGFVMMDFSFSILSFDIAELIVLLALIFSYISGYQYISGYIQKTK